MTTNKCVSAAYYQDPAAALDWLERAFGFETTMRISDGDGNIVHAEMEAEGDRLMVGPVGWSDFAKSPKSVGGANTQSLQLDIGDLDAHFAKAKAAGAKIVEKPTEQFYGARIYKVADPEGHIWAFAQQIREVSLEEAGKAIGLKVELLDRK